jgi:hypothetical protein
MEERMLKQLSIVVATLTALPCLAQAQQYGQGQTMPAQPQMQTQTQNAQPHVHSQAVQPQMQTQGVQPQMQTRAVQPQTQPMGQAMPAQAPMQGQGAPTMNNAAPSQAQASNGTGGTFKDEYGNLYNSRGDRIDRRGRILPPQWTGRVGNHPCGQPGAELLRRNGRCVGVR